MRGILRLRNVKWRYPRRVTTAAVLGVAGAGAALGYAALPTGWRPASALWILPAMTVSYAAMVIGSHKSWTKRFKHEVLDALGGDVDHATPWLLSTVVGTGFLLAVVALRRVFA